MNHYLFNVIGFYEYFWNFFLIFCEATEAIYSKSAEMNGDGLPNGNVFTGGNTAPFIGSYQTAGRRIFDLLKILY